MGATRLIHPRARPARRAAPGALSVVAATGPARRRLRARAIAVVAPESSADDGDEDSRSRLPAEGTNAEGSETRDDDDESFAARSSDALENFNGSSAADTPLPASDAPDASDGFKELVKFTLPTMAIWMCGPVLSMVDTAVVGTASTLELAAMTPGGVFVDYTAYLIASSLATATTTLVARDRLRRDAKAANAACEKTIADGLALASISGVALALALRLVAEPVVAAFAGPLRRRRTPPRAALRLRAAVGRAGGDDRRRRAGGFFGVQVSRNSLCSRWRWRRWRTSPETCSWSSPRAGASPARRRGPRRRAGEHGRRARVPASAGKLV